MNISNLINNIIKINRLYYKTYEVQNQSAIIQLYNKLLQSQNEQATIAKLTIIALLYRQELKIENTNKWKNIMILKQNYFESFLWSVWTEFKLPYDNIDEIVSIAQIMSDIVVLYDRHHTIIEPILKTHQDNFIVYISTRKKACIRLADVCYVCSFDCKTWYRAVTLYDACIPVMPEYYLNQRGLRIISVTVLYMSQYLEEVFDTKSLHEMLNIFKELKLIDTSINMDDIQNCYFTILTLLYWRLMVEPTPILLLQTRIQQEGFNDHRVIRKAILWLYVEMCEVNCIQESFSYLIEQAATLSTYDFSQVAGHPTMQSYNKQIGQQQQLMEADNVMYEQISLKWIEDILIQLPPNELLKVEPVYTGQWSNPISILEEEEELDPSNTKTLSEMEGSSGGTICLVSPKGTSTSLIRKKYTIDVGERSLGDFLRELAILLYLPYNPYIIRLQAYSFHAENQTLSLFFKNNGQNLYSYYKEFSKTQYFLKIQHAKLLMKQLLMAVEHLHNNNIIHRDIKTANICIQFDQESKLPTLTLIDFDATRPILARPSNIYTPNNRVTLPYRPPEILFGSTDYNKAADMWSVGCVFLEMYSVKNHYYFDYAGQRILVQDWERLIGPINMSIFPYADPKFNNLIKLPKQDLFYKIPNATNIFKNLIYNLLTYDPNQRFTATEALQHEFFQL